MTAVQAIAEMMQKWNEVYAAAQKKYPSASIEELYMMTKAVMDKSLNLA